MSGTPTISWDGDAGPADRSWLNPLNWTGDRSPTPEDDVEIRVADQVIAVELSGGSGTAASVRSLYSEEDLHIEGSLFLAAPSEIAGNLFLQQGALNLQTGAELTLRGPGYSSILGPLNVPAGAAVHFNSGIPILSGGVIGGTLNIAEGVTVSLTEGIYTLQQGASILGDGVARISQGTVIIEGNVTAQNVLMNNLGDVTGPGTLTITERFSWEAGTLSGQGSLVIAPSATFHIPKGWGRTLAGREITIQGMRTWERHTWNDGWNPNTQTSFFDATSGAPLAIYDGRFDNDALPLSAMGLAPFGTSPAPQGPLTDAQIDALAHQIYEAMFGGVFGAGVDKEAVYRALENRSLPDVNRIIYAYNIRYQRTMTEDLLGQWSIWFSSSETARIEELLDGNQAGAHAVQARALLQAGVRGHEALFKLRNMLYRGNISAIATEYARLYPEGRVQFSLGEAPPSTLPPLQYDLQYALSDREQYYELLAGEEGTGYTTADLPYLTDEANDIRASFEFLFAGNRVASAAAALHGLRARVEIRPNDSKAHDEMINLVQSKSQSELSAINADYRQRYGASILDSLDPGRYRQERDLIDAILNGGRFAMLAYRLRQAFDQDSDGVTDDDDGTDEEAVWDILDGLYADERAWVARLYRERYDDRSLHAEIQAEFSDNMFDGPELEKANKIYGHGGLTVAERIHYAVEGWGTSDNEIKRAMRQLRQMTPQEIQAAQQEYAHLAPPVDVYNDDGAFTGTRPATFEDAFRGDLTGGDLNDAILSLEGKITTVEQYYQLARRRYEYDRGDTAANWLGNLLSGVNTQGANYDRTWQQIQAEYEAISNHGDLVENYPNFHRLIQRSDQDVESYRGFRAAAADLAANSLGTVAGILVVIGSGGAATPVVVALAAGFGGITQALTRMGVEGTFTWEELPADLALGAVSGATAAFSFPPAARQAILNGTAQVGVLRQVAGSAALGGGASAGLGAALNENTWEGGFAAGLANVAQAAALGAFAGSALSLIPGATLTLARSTGLTALTRRVVTNTGSELVQLFSAGFHRLVREGMDAGRSFADALADNLANFAQRLDDVSLLLFNATATDTAANVRQAIRNLLASDSWPPFGFEGVADVGTELWIAQRGQLAGLGQDGIRDQLLNGLQMVFNTMSEKIDELVGRMTGAGAATATRDIAEELAERLANVQNYDEATIREAVQAILPEQAGNQQLIRSVRNLLVIEALPGANPALRSLGEELANRAKSLYIDLLTPAETGSATIATSRVRIDGIWVEVVTMNGGARPSAVEKVRQAVQAQGGIFRLAPERVHAERFLYQEFSSREGFEAIGVSHYNGPFCRLRPSCAEFFERVQFSNVFWDGTYVRVP